MRKISTPLIYPILFATAIVPYMHTIKAPLISDDQINRIDNNYAKDLSLAIRGFGKADAAIRLRLYEK